MFNDESLHLDDYGLIECEYYQLRNKFIRVLFAVNPEFGSSPVSAQVFNSEDGTFFHSPMMGSRAREDPFAIELDKDAFYYHCEQAYLKNK